jgi:hypothetical protein
MSTNATGRLDLFVMNLSQALCAQFKAKTGLDLWANGGERITRAFIDERGIPTEPVDLPMTIARNVGILPKRNPVRRQLRKRNQKRAAHAHS